MLLGNGKKINLQLRHIPTSSDSPQLRHGKKMKGKLPTTQKVPTRCQDFRRPYFLKFRGIIFNYCLKFI